MYRTVLAIIFLLAVNANAEWKLSGIVGVSYNETSVSDNWSGGETDVRNWLFKGEGTAESDTEKNNWLNTLKLEFGKSSIQGAPEQENADLVDIDSVYSFKVARYINPYVSVMFDTQFTEVMNPCTYGESAGIGMVLIKGERSRTSRQDSALH